MYFKRGWATEIDRVGGFHEEKSENKKNELTRGKKKTYVYLGTTYRQAALSHSELQNMWGGGQQMEGGQPQRTQNNR